MSCSEPSLPEAWETADSDQRTSMIMRQILVNSAQSNDLLAKVNILVPLVNALNTRCKKLEFENEELKRLLSNNNHNAEVKISNIPLSVDLPVRDIAKAVLKNLNLESLEYSILSVRKINYKSSEAQASNIAQSQSIVIQFSSVQIRDFVVQSAKRNGGLFSDDVFPEFSENHSKVYTNEFFSQSTHSLLLKTKEKAKLCNFKFTWARSGVIYSRKDENSTPIPIITESDLDKIM